MAVRTSNRNFKGRAGNPTAEIYLVSPESAATAIRGTFASAEDIMGEQVVELAKITEPEQYMIDDSMIITPLLDETTKIEIIKGPNIKFLPVPEAALKAASIIAERPENEGKNIVILLPDSGDRYLSTQFFA